MAPGKDRSVQLGVRPKAQLSSWSARAYPFVVVVRPAQAPEFTHQVQGEWTHHPLDFDLEIGPRRQVGIAQGVFRVKVSNHGSAVLEVQLGAKDPAESCQYAFEPAKLTVPAGSQKQAKLGIRTKTPISTGSGRTYAFTVTAHPTSAPRLIREAQGEWELVPPAFQVALEPQAQSGTTEGTYRVPDQQSVRCRPERAIASSTVAARGCCRCLPFRLYPSPGERAGRSTGHGTAAGARKGGASK